MTEPSPPQQIRALVVEDNEADREILQEFIQDPKSTEPPVDLAFAASLTEALAYLGDHQPDVVLLDLGLPDASGLEGLERVLEEAPRTAVIVLTGLADQRLTMRALREGAQDYILKDELASTNVRRCLEFAIQRQRADLQTRRLECSERHASLGRLAAGAAQALTDPAGIILGSLLVLERAHRELMAKESNAETLSPKVADALQASGRALERFKTMTASLRSFSTLDADRIKRVDLDNTVREACALLEYEARDRAQLTKDLDGDLPPVHGDRGKLVQMVVNLMVNGLQALPQDADPSQHRIRVRTTLEGDTIVIQVRDTGTGIPRNAADRIFEPFFSTKPPEIGTGLGLPFCREVAGEHGGTVELENAEGGGVLATVRIPVETGLALGKARRVTETAPPAPAGGEVLPGPYRLLLVDDDEDLLATYASILDHHDVETLTRCEDVLDRLAQGDTWDAVLCDLNLPGMDGPGLHEQVERAFPDLAPRLVFWSGGGFTPRTTAFLERVPNIMIDKPANPETVTAVLERVASGQGPAPSRVEATGAGAPATPDAHGDTDAA